MVLVLSDAGEVWIVNRSIAPIDAIEIHAVAHAVWWVG